MSDSAADVPGTPTPSTETPAPADQAPAWHRLADGAITSTRQPPSLRRVVTSFLCASLAAVVLLVCGSLWVSREAAEEESVADARRTADFLATTLVEPAIEEGLLSGNESDVEKLDEVVRERVIDPGIAVRVKIWTQDGRIIYSDERRLIGAQYWLGEEEREAVLDGRTEAELSDLSGPENQYERQEGRQLLEVYRPVRSPKGELLLFEMYAPYSEVTSGSSEIWRRFAPVTIGGLLLLQALQLPLALRMVRQLRDGQQERDRLLQRAAAASDDERRRIAGNLHDGVVQDLAGASFLLAGVLNQVESPERRDAEAQREASRITPATAPEPSAASTTVDAAPAMRRALHAVRQSIGSLRSLLVEIYPASLAQAGLPAALAGITVPLKARDVTVTLSVSDDPLPPAVEALVFRVAQEALRNIAKHARAQSVEVRVEHEALLVRLYVCDDGVGFDPASIVGNPASGHFGMQVLTDLATDAGAVLDVATAPGQGTQLRLEVPLP